MVYLSKKRNTPMQLSTRFNRRITNFCFMDVLILISDPTCQHRVDIAKQCLNILRGRGILTEISAASDGLDVMCHDRTVVAATVVIAVAPPGFLLQSSFLAVIIFKAQCVCLRLSACVSDHRVTFPVSFCLDDNTASDFTQHFGDSGNDIRFCSNSEQHNTCGETSKLCMFVPFRRPQDRTPLLAARRAHWLVSR